MATLPTPGVTTDWGDDLNAAITELTAFVGACVERTTAQSIPTATWTVISFNAADSYDTSSIHDPAVNSSRLTVPAGLDGVWRFQGTMQFAAHPEAVRAVAWKKNGSDLADRFGAVYTRASPAYSTIVTTGFDVSLAAGDYIEFRGYHETGSPLSVSSARVTCQFLG